MKVDVAIYIAFALLLYAWALTRNKFNFFIVIVCFFCYLFQLSEQEVETVLDKCMVLFRFLQEKVTEGIDCKHLRLVCLSSVETLAVLKQRFYTAHHYLYNTQGRI